MAATSQGLDDFIQQLKAPRFIKIFVGDQTEPYEIPESMLVNASDYFARAIKHENSMGGSEPGVLRFKEDGELLEGWKVLLYWIVHRDLPRQYQEIVFTEKPKSLEMVQTWVLGDRYLLPELQDSVVVELLANSLNEWFAEDHVELYSMLQISPVGSKLRRLLAEEAILWPTSGSKARTWVQYLEEQNGVFGLAGSLLAAHEAFTQHNKTFPRVMDDLRKRMPAWQEYLMGSWPRKFWIFRDLREADMDPDDIDWIQKQKVT
ncbi:hypothetical protein PRZ48_013935 [Zasmidium cellare]|uniref:BTB domain-containing protein n=1 Tax=Zasmidium cellare TaxID=395010 RepID=A0ABR0DZR0_ZASCE|nr:hypothetical protein PRZ48_013935 [Zasmidium cellare]